MKSVLPLLSLIIVLVTSQISRAQELVSITSVASLSTAQVSTLLGVPGMFPVEAYRVVYTLTDDLGMIDTVSGLITMPADPMEASALVVYGHGTSNDTDDVPSMLNSGYFEAVAYATSGFVCGATDYIGLGISTDRFHPYVHAETEAIAMTAMAEIAFDVMDDMGIAHNRSIFLSGYSQGGHASMATQQYIANDPSIDIQVMAAAHGSGPYSVSDVMRKKVLDPTPYIAGLAYVPYLIAGYESAYGDIYNDLSDIFLPSFAAPVEEFINYDENLTGMGTRIGAQLLLTFQSLTPINILQPSVVTRLETNDPSDSLIQHLRDNDTYRFNIASPTQMYYCEADEQVPYQNALFADSVFTAQGASMVSAISLDPNADHGGCALLAIPASIAYFNLIFASSTDDIASPSHIRTYPNPVSDVLHIEGSTAPVDVTIYDMQGRKHTHAFGVQETLSVRHLTPGAYVVEIRTEGDVMRKQIVKQ